MQNSQSEEDFTLSFGYQEGNPSGGLLQSVIVGMVNTNRSVMDPKTIRQCKADQARILEKFNSPYYSLLEFGAENMLSFEQLGRLTMELLSGSLFVEKWKSFLNSLKEANQSSYDDDDSDTVTVTKVDMIQKQLDALVAQMEKVKEESRRKSEELETLRRRVQESDTLSQNTTSIPHSRADSIQFPNLESKPNESISYTDDSYLMDFSKPASYQPSRAAAPDPPVIVRRRSLEPTPLPKESSRPTVPTAPLVPPVPPVPPRRSISRDHAKPAPPVSAAPASVPVTASVNAPASAPVNAHSVLMEEIRQSAQQRMKKSEEEKQPSAKEREAVVRGTQDESEVTKSQRQLKLSLNDEIRQKMKERLQVMQESDSDEHGNVNEMD